MSVSYYGDFAEDDTVDIPFNTFDSNDPSASVTMTNFVNTDVHIHKDGGITQRNNAAGITVSVDFDSITGNHLIQIDTSDDTVGGFWVTGSEYQVRIEGTTVDGATVNAWIGAFSIERAGGVIALLKLIQAAVITNAAGTDVAADIIAVKAETATIVTDTNEIQGKLPTNKFMGSSDGADDDGNINSILADTNELQGDWTNGGRLDLLLDAIKVVTDNQAAASTTLITGTVSWDNTNATTTVIYSDDVTEATADHYNGRLFVPTSGALLGQYTDITDYALDTGEGKFTVTALTEAPADNTTFVII